MRIKVSVALMLVAGLMMTAASAQVVWDNGPADGVNGYRPTLNWDPLGIIEDFEVPSHGYNDVNFFHVEMIDGTAPPGTPSIIDETRIRLFDAPNGLANVDVVNDTPVFDHTYTEASGEMVEIDSGIDMFNFDLVYFDCTGPVASLAPGNYGMFLTYPGQGPITSFWATSNGGPDGAGSEVGGVTGPDVPYSPTAHHAFRLEIPEPATLSLLGLGCLALLRRR